MGFDGERTSETNGPGTEMERLRQENGELRRNYAASVGYVREKINQLLTVMGTLPLKPEELDDRTLIEIDPIGIISDSFVQILRHLHSTNDRLKITNEEIQAIFDSAGMGILVIDREMNILAYNRQLKEQFFADKTIVEGMACYQAVCNMEVPPSQCPFLGIFDTGESVQRMGWVLHDRHFNVVGTPVRDEKGEITRVVLVYMDMTERVRAEEALRMSEAKYRDLFENANDLIQSVAPDGSFLYVNRAWRETLGYSEDEVLGLSIFDIIHPGCEDCSAELKSVVFGEKAGSIETRFVTRDKRELIVEGNVNTIMEEGRLVGTRGILRDITGRKKSEEVLASERERLSAD